MNQVSQTMTHKLLKVVSETGLRARESAKTLYASLFMHWVIQKVVGKDILKFWSRKNVRWGQTEGNQLKPVILRLGDTIQCE